MTLHEALNADLPRLARRDLDEARRRIGGQKLSLRRAMPLWQAIPLLRPLTRRIDQINEEDVERQQPGRTRNQ